VRNAFGDFVGWLDPGAFFDMHQISIKYIEVFVPRESTYKFRYWYGDIFFCLLMIDRFLFLTHIIVKSMDLSIFLRIKKKYSALPINYNISVKDVITLDNGHH